MTATRMLRVGTRASALARTQTGLVVDALGAPVEIVPIVTEGDRSSAALAQIGGTGVFVSALRSALLRGEIDVAVHSYKDLPTAAAPGIALAAVPAREDSRDALVARDGLTLAEAWRAGPEAFHGIHVAGFPNLFLMLGPNTATGHTSTLLYIEPAMRHAQGCMRAVREGGHRGIEVRAEVMRAHNAARQAGLEVSVWAGCRSWYRREDGKVVAIFPGYTGDYSRGVARVGWGDFRFIG